MQAKSSVAGVNFRATGANYFNPDEACLEILAANPGTALAEANAAAWQQGKRLLEQSIARGLSFAFETTLGGNTIPALLYSAAEAGIDVHIWYVGLSSPELHIDRSARASPAEVTISPSRRSANVMTTAVPT